MTDTSPFRAYERVKTERREVATITEGNIHIIARMVKGVVDYSKEKPAIIQNGNYHPIGREVTLRGETLVNMNGFNSDGSWKELDDAV